MFNKQSILYILMALIIIGAFAYMVYGAEDNGSGDRDDALYTMEIEYLEDNYTINF